MHCQSSECAPNQTNIPQHKEQRQLKRKTSATLLSCNSRVLRAASVNHSNTVVIIQTITLYGILPRTKKIPILLTKLHKTIKARSTENITPKLDKGHPTHTNGSGVFNTRTRTSIRDHTKFVLRTTHTHTHTPQTIIQKIRAHPSNCAKREISSYL